MSRVLYLGGVMTGYRNSKFMHMLLGSHKIVVHCFVDRPTLLARYKTGIDQSCMCSCLFIKESSRLSIQF